MKSRVVIVENEPEAVRSTSGLLVAEGYEVAVALTCERALQMIAARRPDVVLFTLLKPATSGIDFARRLALTADALVLPVVMVTALDEYQVGSFLDGVPGIRTILHQPCFPKVILEKVADTLRNVHH